MSRSPKSRWKELHHLPVGAAVGMAVFGEATLWFLGFPINAATIFSFLAFLITGLLLGMVGMTLRALIVLFLPPKDEGE
jgi:hypothetical protein